jgi:tetratricopeptide (TPR) repeat protein
MEAIERAELLERAEGLLLERKFSELATLLERDVTARTLQDVQLSFFLALAWSHTGRESAALTLAAQLLKIHRNGPRDRLLIRLLNLEGALLMESGALDAASKRFKEVLSFASVAYDPRFVAAATMNLATINAMQHRFYDAIAELNRAIAVSGSAGLRHQVAGCHHNLGMVLRDSGSFAESSRHFSQARRMYKVWGTQEEQAGTEYESALMIALSGDVRFGLRRAVDALNKIQDMKHLRLEGEALRVVGIVQYLIGEKIFARSCLEKARKIAVDCDLTLLRAESCECLHFLLQDQGLGLEASKLKDEAVELYRTIGIPPGKGVQWMTLTVSDQKQKAS